LLTCSLLIDAVRSRYPFNIRSFFTPDEIKDIGMGIVLWRGYFQSVRPAVGRMLVNVDISTGTMYKPGNVLDICLELLGLKYRDIAALHAGNLNQRDALQMSRFLLNVRVWSNVDRNIPPRSVKRILVREDASTTFSLNRDGQPPRTITVAVRIVTTLYEITLTDVDIVHFCLIEVLPGDISSHGDPS